MKFTSGADIEVFLKEKGKYKSAARILSGTKTSPEKMACGAGLHFDNVACEFSSVVSTNEEEFIESLEAPLKEVGGLVSPLTVEHKAFADFPENQTTLPEEQEFGCDPDFDAWSLTINDSPDIENKQFRSCGGHVHLGYTEGSPEELQESFGKVKIVKMLDIFLGIPFVILDPSHERRKLYGKAGSHRPKDYGVEYRVLSNMWTANKTFISLVYKLVNSALANLDKFEEVLEQAGGEKTVIKCINEGKTEEAFRILDTVVFQYLDEDTKEQWRAALSLV
jgi:hypothetical protein